MAGETNLQVASVSPRVVALQRQQEFAELFRPTSFAEAFEFAKVLSDSGMVPKSYAGKPAAIIATWQHGLELGVGLMQALQGISNINGNPSVFGDLGWALVQNHPDFVDSIEELTDTYAVCTLKRRGRSDKTWKYTLEMAKQNDLLGKDNWKKNPKRMLQWRARSWAMRDQFPDSLKGMVIYEEAQDYTAGETIEGAPVTGAPAPEPEKVEETVGQPGGSEFYKKYKASGWTPEQAKSWLSENLKIGPPHNELNSKDIPVSQKEKAFAWADTHAPARVEAEKKFKILDWTSEERLKFFQERKGDWDAINKELAEEIAKRDAVEGA